MQPNEKLIEKIEMLEHQIEDLRLAFDQHAHSIERVNLRNRDGQFLTPPITAYRILNPLILEDCHAHRVFKFDHDNPRKIAERHLVALADAEQKVKEYQKCVSDSWEKRGHNDYEDNSNSEGNTGSMVSF